MKYIVVDLEMNPIAKEHIEKGQLCKTEIIQIGAVAMDEEFQVVDTFSTYVKPQFNNIITKKIVNLTKITTEMVENAPCFEDALHLFLSWCIDFGDEVQIQQWSESDQEQIFNELSLKEIRLSVKEKKILLSWVDFQKEFGEVLNLSRKVSLKNAIMYAGIDMKGYHHNALYDAGNTATLLSMIKSPDLYKTELGKVIKMLNPTPLKTSLGDMFNFQDLAVSV